MTNAIGSAAELGIAQTTSEFEAAREVQAGLPLFQSLLTLELPRLPQDLSAADQESQVNTSVEWLGFRLQLQVFRGHKATTSQLQQLQSLRQSYKIWGDLPHQLSHVTERETDTHESNTHVILTVKCPGSGNEHTYCVTAEELVLSNGQKYDELDLWTLQLGETTATIRELLKNPAKAGATFAHLTRLGTTSTLNGETHRDLERFEKVVSIMLTFYLALFYCRADYYISQNPPSLREVFSAKQGDNSIRLSFPSFTETFGLPTAQTYLAINAVDSDVPHTVQEYCFYWPGYWFNTEFFARHIRQLASQGIITDDDINMVFEKSGQKSLKNPQEKLEKLLSKATFFKFFTHLFTQKQEIFRGLFSEAQLDPANCLQPVLCAYTQAKFMEEIGGMVDVLEQDRVSPATDVIRSIPGAPAATVGAGVAQSIAAAYAYQNDGFILPNQATVERARGNFVSLCSELLRTSPVWGLPVLQQLIESAGLTYNPAQLPTPDQLAAGLIANGKYNVVLETPSTGVARLYGLQPAEERYAAMAVNSRSVPDLAPDQIEHARAHLAVIIFGGSTGSPIAEELAPLINEVHIADFDTVEASNIRRMEAGITESEIGENKATAVQETILHRYPTANVTAHPHSMSEDELESLIRKLQRNGKTVYIVDAIDDVSFKMTLRKVARRLNVHLVMHTNLIGHSNIQIEAPTERRYFKQVSEETIRKLILHNKSLEAQIAALHALVSQGDTQASAKLSKAVEARRIAGVRLFLKVIGISNMPPTQMLNFIMLAHGRQMYLAQTPLGSHAGGALAADTIVRHFLGEEVKHNATYQLHTQMTNARKSEGKRLLRIMTTHADIFPEARANHADAHDIIADHAQKLFKMKWDWSYT